MKVLKLALSGVSNWLNKPDTNKTIVEGVERVTSYRTKKRKIALIIIAILSLLLAFGKIDLITFVELFKEVE